MASTPTVRGSEKLSFAKVSLLKEVARTAQVIDSSQIAAAGLKPQIVPSVSSNKTQRQAVASPPRSGDVNPSNELSQPTIAAQPKRLVQLAPRSAKDPSLKAAVGPEVHIHSVDGTSPQAREPPATDGLLVPSGLEDSATQLSSSSGSAKPPSLDGKSVASGTTFTLDEKESLRPDDSASVKAAEDEEELPLPETDVPDLQAESEQDVRAFRAQLCEISAMEPTRRGTTPLSLGHNIVPPQGLLYIPPQGPGIGPVPLNARVSQVLSVGVALPPDTKLLEALESAKDRIWVLKLEQDITDFVKDPKEASLNLPQCNAYHRMLAHKMADYYLLGHIVDDSASAVRLYKTPNCRMAPPLTALTTPSTAASTPPPTGAQMKILRRGDPDGGAGSGLPSKSASENGDSGEDAEKSKLPVTREEREARYAAARLRIMGTTKSAEAPEDVLNADASRSSSVAPKKKTRKQRGDSDDGFESRSAYGAYYAQPYGNATFPTVSYGAPAFGQAGAGGTTATNPGFANTGYPQYDAPLPSSEWWTGDSQVCSPTNQQWPQAQLSGYDLSGAFQRSMNIQAPSAPSQAPTMPTGYTPSAQQQYYGAQQSWPQQAMQQAPQQHQLQIPAYGVPQNFVNSPASGPAPIHDYHTGYAFGQLPSQTFPGRSPSNLEHPLPGSYKNKLFNPQSQAFIPGQQASMPYRPFPQQAGLAYNPGLVPGYVSQSPLQRQPSSMSQTSSYGSPHQHSPAVPGSYAQPGPMMHPLPQPVFPRQPSPNVPLPPKPEASANHFGGSAHANASQGPGHSSIAKWGIPASLPAKPPPPAAEYAPFQRQQGQYSAATAAARVPSGGMPRFGEMPQMALHGNGNGIGKR